MPNFWQENQGPAPDEAAISTAHRVWKLAGIGILPGGSVTQPVAHPTAWAVNQAAHLASLVSTLKPADLAEAQRRINITIAAAGAR